MPDLPPVAFFIFARPSTTAKVWKEIRKARPKNLLVVADAARAGRPEEAQRCLEARKIARPDWPCQVRRLYAKENMGCGRRVSSGLDWVFSQASEAIILEDDCVPHPHFFRWCRSMLERYRGDERVMSVSGFVPPGEETARPHFSRYHSVWGWASWRRAWRHYDYSMSQWPRMASSPFLKERMPNSAAVRFWSHNFWGVHDKKNDTWDHQWNFSCWLQDGVALVPPVNLISNIGAIHSTHEMDALKMNVPTAPLPRTAFQPIPLVRDGVWDDAHELRRIPGVLSLGRRIVRRLKRETAGLWPKPSAASDPGPPK